MKSQSSNLILLLYFLLDHCIRINILQTFSPITLFTSDLLFITPELDKFYFETLNNLISRETISNSIINKRIKPILSHISLDFKIDDRFPIYIIKEIIENFTKFRYKLDDWKISDEDYLFIVEIFRKYESNRRFLPLLETSNYPTFRNKICIVCDKLLSLQPYFAIYRDVNFFHYFCYLLTL